MEITVAVGISNKMSLFIYFRMVVFVFILFGVEGSDEGKFKDRCETYLKNNPIQKNCHGLWDSFKKRDFRRFAEDASSPLEYDKSVYYTGFKFERGSAKPGWIGNGYITVEDTLAGYIISEISICQSKKSPCWLNVSVQYAKDTVGVATLLLNADNQEVYSDESTFHKYELPNFVRVTKLQVLLRKLKQDSTENCSSGSLYKLKASLHRGMHYACSHDQRDLESFACRGVLPNLSQACGYATHSRACEWVSSGNILKFSMVNGFLNQLFSWMSKLMQRIFDEPVIL